MKPLAAVGIASLTLWAIAALAIWRGYRALGESL